MTGITTRKARLGHVPASMMMNQPVGRAAEDLFENHERVSTGGTTGSQNKNTCSTTADELALICTMHGHASLAFSGSQSLSCEKLYGSGLFGHEHLLFGCRPTENSWDCRIYGRLARSNSVRLSPN